MDSTIIPAATKPPRDRTKRVRGARGPAPEVYIPRETLPNEALSPSDDLFARTSYRTGDGDILSHRRANSDHSHLPSRGF